MNWYYASAGQPVGPITEMEFDNLVRAGTVKADTLVWREGMANWQAYGTLSAPGGAAAGTSEAAVAEQPPGAPTRLPSDGAAPSGTGSPMGSTREAVLSRD